MSVLEKKKNQGDELVDAAQSAIEQQVSRGEYSSPWQNSLNDTIDRILNREKFSYDMNADAFYQQAKDRYVQQGQQAMMDAIGQQSALTGGYGNSWAQTVGQQAYHGYLQGLNDNLIDFYNIAKGAYDAETDDLYNQFNLYNDREKQEYARYIDNRDFNEQIRQFLAANPDAAKYYKQFLGEGGEVNLEELADSAVSKGNALSGASGKVSSGSSYNSNSNFSSGSDDGNKNNNNGGGNKTDINSALNQTDSNREKAQIILNALVNGTISDSVAEKLLEENGITEREVQRAAGIQNAGYVAPQWRPSQAER